MPAIKKRITAEYLEREQQRTEQNGRGATGDRGDDDENLHGAPPPAPPTAMSPGAGGAAGVGLTSPVKRKPATGAHLLKGLDGEVLVEKRKRTLPPAELKLDSWLEENFEKKADCQLSVKKLYQLYTDLCQQDNTTVVELEVFRHMLVNKFGKEFGVRDNSAYSGLLKEAKPRKKPVVAPSLGYKLKDLIHEALKASGNPTKGVMFSWVKKFIAAKYPALQIELKPHFLRSALQREQYSGRVELVKGIGFCGFYRLPGPPDMEEETKGKKNKPKKKTEEGADSADDRADTAEEDSDKPQVKTEDSAAEKTDDKDKTTDAEESMEETGGEDKEEKKGDDKKESKKAAKKKKKRPAKPKWKSNGARHSDPQTLNDVFPLAMTYMAEPKEASFTRIRKYLQKYYDKVDIDSRLKRCMEHGCETGMWDRVSGSGASGSFQLQVDSFNPQHTESLTDMVCSAIIACTEPKISSVRLLKTYITEYHPDFNIDTRPVRLRFALERAEKQNQLRRISGIGMSGSFQLVDQFTPSPAILAGDDDDEEDDNGGDDDLVGSGKAEVYVVRKTKSGRRAPIEKTQLDFSATYKKKGSGKSSGGGTKRKASAPKRKYSEESSSEEEEEESLPEEEEEKAGYNPRPSKSRGGGGGGRGSTVAPAKKRAPPQPARGKKQAAAAASAAKGGGQRRGGSKPTTVAASSPSPRKIGGARQTSAAATKTARRPPPPRRKAEEEEEEEEEEEADSPPPPPSRRTPPAKKSATMKRGRGSRILDSEEEEEEEEEEVATPPPVKKAPPPPGRRGRMTKIMDSEEEEEEEEDTPPKKTTAKKSPPVRRGGGAAVALKAKVSEDEDEDMDDEENYYEVEEERAPVRRGGGGGATSGRTMTPGSKGKATPSPRKGPARKDLKRPSTPPTPSSEGRTPRSASRSARKSLKEMDSDDEGVDDDEEYEALPTASRGGRKR